MIGDVVLIIMGFDYDVDLCVVCIVMIVYVVFVINFIDWFCICVYSRFWG